ncbi:MAG: serine/threonine protein kinase, partial [Anaerolineales bacterium]
WNVSDGSLLQTLEDPSNCSVWSVAFSPDGQTLASGSGCSTIRLWNVGDGTLLQFLEGHTSAVSSFAFSPDRQMLASGSYDGTIRIWGVAP